MVTADNHSPDTNPTQRGWIAMDLDGTLATYDARHGVAIVGKAIESIVFRVKHWLDMGIEVRVFTARASDPTLIAPIQSWLIENGLPDLVITNRRDMDLMQLWDDRVVQTECNSGTVLTPPKYISLDITGWVGVELDGTLAHYEARQDVSIIGIPVEKMRARVQQWLMVDIDVRLFTGRAADPKMIPVMEAWLKEHGLEKLKITCEKDFMMSQFWDDRGIHVARNSGEVIATLNSLMPERKYP